MDLPYGYDDKYVKEDAIWNQSKEKKRGLERLFKEVVEEYQGQHVEIALVAHSSVIDGVLGLSKSIIDESRAVINIH